MIKEIFTENGIIITEEQEEMLQLYYEILVEWNVKMNLTAITEYKDVILKHFLDSALILKSEYFINRKHASVLDIGTGAGFPGIVLAILCPQYTFTLVDSLMKRIEFLHIIKKELKLNHVSLYHGRAEDFAKPGQLREQYDLCVSRAVANLSVLSEYCLPYVTVGGKFISYKSEKIVEEMKDAEYAIQLLGGRIGEQVSFKLPDSDLFRNLFVVEKCDLTPAKYPRKAGMASRKPLKRG